MTTIWKERLEGAPNDPGPINKDLFGWLVPNTEALPYSQKFECFLCANCAGRIMARGFLIPRNSTPVWIQEAVCSQHCAACDSEIQPKG